MGILDSIKKEAENKGVKIQTSEEQELEHKLNNLFYLDKNIPEEVKFLKSVMTRGEETTERKGLHASAVITAGEQFCYRQQVLSLFYKMDQGEQVPVGLKRIFEEGNAIHEKWQRLFIRGGYAKPLDCDFSQFREEYDLSFTPDIICEMDGVKYVVEIKSVNTNKFKTMKYHETGRKQLQLYMHLTGIHKGFVLCDDKNTQDFRVYLYDYNYEEIADVIERLENIQKYKKNVTKKHRMIKRHPECTGYGCEKAAKCPMREACYGRNKERI